MKRKKQNEQISCLNIIRLNNQLINKKNKHKNSRKQRKVYYNA